MSYIDLTPFERSRLETLSKFGFSTCRVTIDVRPKGIQKAMSILKC